MSNGERSKIIISAALAIIIIIAIAVIIYVNLSKEEQQLEENELEGYVNIIYGEQTYNYTINDLIDLGSYTGTGSYIKLGWLPQIVIDGPFNYTGVKITTLLNNIDNLPDSYNIIVKASDGIVTNYSYNEIIGNVEVYNNSGNVTGIGGVTMILAFIQDEDYITHPDEGPLRIAFLDNGSITSSKLWTKLVTSIEVFEN